MPQHFYQKPRKTRLTGMSWILIVLIILFAYAILRWLGVFATGPDVRVQ